MPTNATYVWDGVKAVRIDDLPASAWTWYTTHATEEEEQLQSRYIRVPWLNRGVGLRASAIAALPFALVDQSGEDYDVSTDWQNRVGFLPNPSRLLYLIESSLSLLGKGYLFKERNRVKLLDLRYIVASTITPHFDEDAGLIGFSRTLNHSRRQFEPEDLVYFWMLDPFVEVGPGNNSPAMAALSAAGVLFNVDDFAGKFFERGAIKVTLLTVKGPIVPAERERLENWWSRVFSGIRGAWQQKIVQADTVEPVVIGEGVGELSDSELTKEKREDISVALGIPMTILWSSEAGGLGGGGVVQSDERKFYEQTLVPEARFIQAVLNEQLFQPMGLRWQFRPETLDVFQTDENQRAQALVHYTNAGYRLSVASQILGVELPPGMEYEDLDTMRLEDKEAGAERFQTIQQSMQSPKESEQEERQNQELRRKAMLADLARWERKALNKGVDCQFESDYIPAATMQWIRARLQDSRIEDVFTLANAELERAIEEAKAATAAPFCQPQTGEPWRWDYP